MAQGIYIKNGILSLDETALVDVSADMSTGVSHSDGTLNIGDVSVMDYDGSGVGMWERNGDVYYGMNVLKKEEGEDDTPDDSPDRESVVSPFVMDVRDRNFAMEDNRLYVMLGCKPSGIQNVLLSADVGVTLEKDEIVFDDENWNTRQFVDITIEEPGVYDVVATSGDVSKNITLIKPTKTILFDKANGFNMDVLDADPTMNGAHVYSSTNATLNGTLAVGRNADGSTKGMASVVMDNVPLNPNRNQWLYFVVVKTSGSNSSAVLKWTPSDNTSDNSDYRSKKLYSSIDDVVSSQGRWIGYIDIGRGIGNYTNVTHKVTLETNNIGYYYVSEIGILDYDEQQSN